MNKIFLLVLSLLLSYSNNLFPQDTYDWQPVMGSSKLTKVDGTVTYVVDSVLSLDERSSAIEKVRGYLREIPS